jgi:hypothetical protein
MQRARDTRIIQTPQLSVTPSVSNEWVVEGRANLRIHDRNANGLEFADTVAPQFAQFKTNPDVRALIEGRSPLPFQGEGSGGEVRAGLRLQGNPALSTTSPSDACSRAPRTSEVLRGKRSPGERASSGDGLLFTPLL